MDVKTLSVLKSVSLLYVEDDSATREELTMILEPWFGEMHVACDGLQGLELFSQHRPDIVVTDVQMPKLNGLLMSGKIREIDANQVIVVISAYNDVEYLFRAIELGIDQYVTKPVNVDTLLKKLVVMANSIVAVRERQRTQALLAQYKTLVDQTAIVCKFDLAGVVSFVNDKMCEITGFTAKELIGRQVIQLHHPSEPAQTWVAMQDCFTHGARWSGLVKKRTSSGKLYLVEERLVPIVDEHGQVTEVVALDLDVTEQYKVYESVVENLSESNRSIAAQRHFFAEYKRALDLGTSICVTDLQQRIISVNKQFEKLVGYSTEALKGKPVSTVMPDTSAQQFIDVIQHPDRERFVSRSSRFLRSDGAELQFSVGFLGIHDVQGAVESVLMICQDITESTRLSREISDTQRELLFMLGEVVETRSLETGQHIRRVAQVARFLALKIGLSEEAAELIEMAAPMHDIGKVGISDAILHKPGKLEADEFAEMMKHANIGFKILGSVDRPLIGVAAAIAHEHHERFDGNGYPQGLVGEEISIEARIVCVADVLDALGSTRAYKVAWEPERIRAYFLEQRGHQFDPALVDLLMAHWDTIQALRGAGGQRSSSTSSFGVFL